MKYAHPAWRSPRWTPLLAALLGLILTVVLARVLTWTFSHSRAADRAAAPNPLVR